METANEQLKKFEIKIQSLGDQELVQTLQKLLEREKRIGDAILLALKEIRARRIYAGMGYSSPFEMLVKHFNLSESSAYTRLQALKLMDAIPEVQADLACGDLSLSNAALVQGFIQRNEKEKDQPLTLTEKKEIVDLVKKKSNRDAKAELAKKDPIVALPPQKEKPLALNHTQLQITVDAETMTTLNEVKQLLSHTIPDGNLKEVLKYMLNLTAQTLKKRKGQDMPKEIKDPSCGITKNKKVKEQTRSSSESVIIPTSSNTSSTFASGSSSFSSEVIPFSSLENSELVTHSCLENQFPKDQSINAKRNQTSHNDKTNKTLTNSGTDVRSKTKYTRSLLQSINDTHLNSLSTQRSPTIIQSTQRSCKTIHSAQRTRFISQATKRKVFQRSGGCCEFISERGKRCNSKHQLEWDHIIPWSQGGGNDENSLRVYCRTHNLYRTKETHGFWYK